jgi:hypothetical protein
MSEQRLSDAQCVILVGMIKRMLQAWDHYQASPEPENKDYVLTDQEMIWEIQDCIKQMEEADIYEPCLPLAVAIGSLRRKEGRS